MVYNIWWYGVLPFGRGLPQKHTKAYKGGRGFKITEFRACALFEWPLGGLSKDLSPTNTAMTE